MSRLSRLLSRWLMLVMLSFTWQAQAEETAAVIESVRQSIQALADSTLSDTEKRDLQELYQNTLTFLQRTQATERDQEALRKQVEEAPAQIRDIRQQLDRSQPVDEGKLRESYERQALADLERQLGERVSRMFAWQNELTSVNSELIAAQTRPERTQASVASNQTREQALSEQIRTTQRQTDTPLNAARLGMLRAEQRSLQRHSDLLRQRLAANATVQDLAAHRRDLLAQQIGNVETEIQLLQDVIDEKRRSESEQAVSDASLLADVSNLQLREQGNLNRQLSEELLRSTTQIGDLTRRNIQTKQQIDSLTHIETALEQQISVLEGSVLLSRILHQQKAALPHMRFDANLADYIADLRLRQFELNQVREDLTNPGAYLDRLLTRLPEEQRATLRGDLEQAINARVGLAEQLSNNINNLLTMAITLQINQRQLQQMSGALNRTIEDQLFWVASNRPLDRVWLSALPGAFASQWQAIHPLEQLKKLGGTLVDNLFWLLVIALLVILYVWRLRALRAQLKSLHADVGHYRRDSTRHTPKAILLTALSVIPVPLVLSGFGLVLAGGEEPAMPAFGTALSQLALAWFMLHLMYRVFDPHGIATRHFQWNHDLVERLHVLIRRVVWVLLPLVLVVALGETRPEHLNDDVIGRIVMAITLIILAFMLGRMMYQSEPLYDSRVIHFSASMILTLTPLALAGMVAYGYTYTAVKLTDRFIATLYLIILWMLVEGAILRNLSVVGRRLAYQRALSRREAAQARDNVDPETSVDVPELNIQQINQQSLRLTRMGLIVVFGVLVYFVWADLISAASYLQSVTLWEYNTGTADSPLMAPLSAGDMLSALIMIAVTFSLARNLPGMLDLVVLSRMNLRQGSSYAITTLLSYVIVSIGLFSALSTLGVSWNKLQWLVAALGVGLGFGLQEIFANFVSGLIILFERPVRIGDVVTIGELSGTVNRIRIRATTITDFDRKEIIVPNKTFVTNQLINWSLNDTITRVTMRVGVAYGSDLAKVKELMLGIAEKNPRVLKDPAPMVLFLNFGDSTLDHELRIHVRELADRNQAIDEINRQIDAQFRDAGIEIAFRQMDINLRNSEGLERLVATKRIDNEAGPTSQSEKPESPGRSRPSEDAGGPDGG
jgi:potassium-dependent mechanosensitive channel